MSPLRPRLLGAAVTLGLLVGACGAGQDPPPADLGGATTRGDATQNAFGFSAPELTNEERRLFEVGDSFFTQNWVAAPASTEARDGLGPTFNGQACASCHVRDGRGAPPDPAGDDARLGLLLRLSVPGEDPVTGAPVDEPRYGGQLQDRASLDVPAEGRVDVSYEAVPGEYGDGSPFELRRPTYEVLDPAFGQLDEHVRIGPRLAPQVIGVGLLEAIPEQELRDAADPEDEDGDGVSGRVNEVWDPRSEGPAIGRFGWKANVATVEAQVAGAFHGDIGITSSLHPDQECPTGQVDCAEAADGGSPELTESRLGAVTFYNRTLSVPAMREPEAEAVVEGSAHFEAMGCAACHTPTQRTEHAEITALADQEFHPYTDLLLHDMGPGLADGRPDFAASASEWRTPPLWGIGLVDEVNGERFLLHDGRARTLAEAILWHGGEAESAREAFRTADEGSRSDLLAFLEAL